MPNELTIFQVVERGERTVVAFCDWPSTRDTIFSHDRPAFIAGVRAELNEVVTRNQSAVLAIEMAPVHFVPSSFLGESLLLHKRGVTIELLHPSETVRRILECTKLERIFAVRQ